MLAPYLAQDMSAQGLLAKDGLCKTFSELADGYARADGVNAVLIKPLADAIRDNDPVRAVIRSTAVGADGKTTNFGVPSPMCQEAMIRHAYQVAGIDDVTKTAFVECHGTGTAVGDPLEMEAVGKVWGEQGIFCGSVSLVTACPMGLILLLTVGMADQTKHWTYRGRVRPYWHHQGCAEFRTRNNPTESSRWRAQSQKYVRLSIAII